MVLRGRDGRLRLFVGRRCRLLLIRCGRGTLGLGDRDLCSARDWGLLRLEGVERRLGWQCRPVMEVSFVRG